MANDILSPTSKIEHEFECFSSVITFALLQSLWNSRILMQIHSFLVVYTF